LVPNIAQARSLVASSGTAGITVDVYALRDDSELLQYVASVLRDIGYRPLTHLFTGSFGAYQQFISEPSHRTQVAISLGWIPDYPRPDAYFDFVFSCQPLRKGNNISGYCQPDVDELVTQAKSRSLRILRLLWTSEADRPSRRG
jgi:ABC-type transport system substrate-binding protein